MCLQPHWRQATAPNKLRTKVTLEQALRIRPGLQAINNIYEQHNNRWGGDMAVWCHGDDVVWLGKRCLGTTASHSAS